MRKLPILILLVQCFILGGCLTSGGSGDDASGFLPDTPGNDAPIINGNPDTAVMINQLYEFEPTVQDPDGDTLTFDIENKPDWAIFESAVGRLWGQPTLGDVGTYENIVVTVTDGEKSDALPAFSVTVTDTALGSVSLSWQPPTENEDGTPVTDLSGYKIYYGKSSGLYDNEVDIGDPDMTNYVVDNLLPDTYYFAATAYNESGVESSYSGEAVRSVN